jgi:hypothetical protein
MDLHVLKTASGLACMAMFGVKILLHILLDRRSNPQAGALAHLLLFGRFFKPYTLQVQQDAIRLKSVCNAMLFLALVTLLLNAAVGIAMLFL